jgi:hypothetical protein
MAKKVPTKPAATAPAQSHPAKPSSLLDTRVVYCGDNLEQLAKLPDAIGMKKEEVRMMKPARFPILNSTFCLLNSSLPASHYVKAMLDQIFGENSFAKQYCISVA